MDGRGFDVSDESFCCCGYIYRGATVGWDIACDGGACVITTCWGHRKILDNVRWHVYTKQKSFFGSMMYSMHTPTWVGILKMYIQFFFYC